MLIIAETSMKGLGYASSEGDAGVGHPDANVVGVPRSFSALMLTETGWLAWRAYPSARTCVHQIELSSPLSTRLHQTGRKTL